MFKTGRKTAAVFEDEVVEFVQEFVGEGVPVVKDDMYNVYLHGKRIGSVCIARMETEKGTARFRELINEVFFGKFNRVLSFSGHNIFVSEVLA